MRRKAGDLLPLEAEVLRIAIKMAEQGTPKFYGWQVGQEIEDETRRATGFGTLYRTLNRMQELGFLNSERVAAEKEGLPARRLYQITPEGRRIYAIARRTPVSAKFIPKFAI